MAAPAIHPDEAQALERVPPGQTAEKDVACSRSTPKFVA
jgi:hypothetical protein